VLIMANFLIIFNEIPFLAAAIAGFLNDFIGFMLEMVAWIDALPGGYIQGLWMGTLTMILIYFTLTTCLIWRESKSRLFFKMFALALMCLMAVFNYEYWEKRNTDVLVVFDVGRSNAIGIVNSGQGLLLSDSTASERQLSFASSGFFAKHAFNVEQKHLFSGGNVDCQSLICTVGDARFLGIGDVDLDLFETENEELSGISGVLFLGDIKGDVIGFLESLGCPDVVVAKTCPPWCVGKWKNDIEKLDIRTHFIAEGGAFLKFY
jgi:competence protein ComEC